MDWINVNNELPKTVEEETGTGQRYFSKDVIVPFVCRDCDKTTKEYRDQLCEPCHKWHTDS